MNHDALVIALIGVLGIGAQWIAWRTGWPAIALMLLAGILAGPVTGLIHPEQDFGKMLDPAISIAVAIILFVGGLNLNFRELRHAEGAVARLVLIGVPISWVLGALACYYVAGLVWPVAILFSGILVVTGPTVVLPLLRQLNIGPRPRAILKWEAIVNDPIGALFAVMTYEYLLNVENGATLASVAISLGAAALVAGLIGFSAAAVIAWLFPRGYVPEFLKAPVLLVAVISTFMLANFLKQETGLLAVTVMGVALANMRLASFRDFHKFKEDITVLLVSGVFILLSASLNLQVLRQFELRFAAFLLLLLLVVRPATVLISLAFSRLPWAERLFIAWLAPRGIVAVAVSGLFALRLGDLGYGDGGTLVTLSVAVVIATIVAHGFTARLLARRLGIESDAAKGLLIVGATPWSLSLAGHLSGLGVAVMVSDTSWQRLTPARAKGIPCFHGEILAEATEDRLDLSQFQMLAATSDNEAYNALVCNEFAPEIGRDSVYQLGSAAGDDPRSLPEKLRGRALFATGLGVEDLAARKAAGWTFLATEVGTAMGQDALKAALPEEADLLLLIRKSGALRFFTHASRPAPEPGDIVVSYAPASAASEAVRPSDAPSFASEVTT
jgi:NhaP-type Na+/H+ or K+/H+ antiporter